MPRLTLIYMTLLFATCAVGQDIVLTPVADSTIFQDDSGPLSNSVGEFLFAGRIQSGQRRRALLRFDLSAIPSEADIAAVELVLFMDRSREVPLRLGVHRVTNAWTEGTSDAGSPGGRGAAATPGDPTWDQSIFPDEDWDTVGGDYVAAPSAELLVSPVVEEKVWTGPGLLADVEAWRQDASSNLGWMLVESEFASPLSAKRFTSRESDALAVPSLRVTLAGQAIAPAVPIPSLTHLGLLLTGLLVLMLGRRRLKQRT